MKRLIVLFAAIGSFLISTAQIKIKNKKYPSLLWEITGKGLKAPSYLFGTMHVSSKIDFNLPDSFYLGIKNANVVALETNPESWQEDMSRFDVSGYGKGGTPAYDNYESLPADYLSVHTLEFDKYEKRIEQALYSNPSVINNLLYRTYGDFSADFEENTYLDMYIYQVGKKWGKRVAGVENYGESMKLMMEAYQDAAKDRNKKERSYDAENSFSLDKLQEAYRSGNLDLLDSLNKLQSFSNAFDEKFLYKRNEIQANSIDSIIKKGSSLFVGVGAAHLPGTRGVIEMLRNMGYKVRPVLMDKKNDAKQKEIVEKINVPVLFHTHESEDGFFKVDIPGKLYHADENYGMFDQQQYADMANGSYYMVSRLKTNNVMWGHTTEEVYKKIDSVLYENIPGKILSKQVVYNSGYKGFDILNRTRRGDYQRYNIFITPFEIIIFKMSGNDEYVKGEEAKRFFSSIKLKDYTRDSQWKKFSPWYGGFAINLPHDAFVSNDGSWLFDAEDKANNTMYRVVRTDIHNFNFAEEDSFDLRLLEESFSQSDFIDKLISRKLSSFKGYPALDCRFSHKDGSVFLVKFIIKGPHYYSLIAHGKKENAAMQDFFNSFELKPFAYGEAKLRTDTSLYFTVKSPVYPESKKEKIGVASAYDYSYDDDDNEPGWRNNPGNGLYRSTTISDDSTGQKIYVSFYKSGKYRYTKDSSRLEQRDYKSYLGGDSTWLVKNVKKTKLPDNTRVWEYVLTKEGSSRVFKEKDYYRSGIFYSLVTQSDSLSETSSFVNTFFETFTPSDTVTGINPFTKKHKEFFGDFFSTDTLARKRAIRSLHEYETSDADFPQFKKAIESFSWKEKKYLDNKKLFIGKLKDIKTKEASDYLKSIYYSAGDTIELQYAALETLLQQQTQYAVNNFRDIITQEPPVLQSERNASYSGMSVNNYGRRYQYADGYFMDELYDSLKLTRTILPGLLPLINLDDYKWHVMRLLGEMIDSNLVNAKEYEPYFNRFLLEAKLELKKQVIAEKKKAIKKAEDQKADKISVYPSYDDEDETKDNGNDDLSLYAVLLSQYYEKNTSVQALFQQLLQSSDDRVKYNTMLLLLQKDKPVPDSIMGYFAAKDEYCYELYSDLKKYKKLDKFPGKYNNHFDLSRSKLIESKRYDKPDTVVYLDRLPATFKDKKGFVYFFRYKLKKDDDIWKLASVGLVMEDEKQFDFADDDSSEDYSGYYGYGIEPKGNFTGFSDTKIKDDEPIADQLREALKKLLYSAHKSGLRFYDAKGYDEDEVTPNYMRR